MSSWERGMSHIAGVLIRIEIELLLTHCYSVSLGIWIRDTGAMIDPTNPPITGKFDPS